MSDKHFQTMPGIGQVLAKSFRREVLIAFRNRGDIANPLIFLLTVTMFIPLGVSPESNVLSGIAPGMIWVVALLATLLSLDKLFEGDYEDGSLEQMMVSGQPLYWLVLVKILVHWLMTGLPLTLLAPILGIMMALPNEAYYALLGSLLLGTGSLSLIGGIGAALTVALRRGGLLLSLIVMPLYVPVLIFGSGAVRNAVDGFPFMGQIAVLGIFFCVSLMLAPLAAAGALRVSSQ